MATGVIVAAAAAAVALAAGLWIYWQSVKEDRKKPDYTATPYHTQTGRHVHSDFSPHVPPCFPSSEPPPRPAVVAVPWGSRPAGRKGYAAALASSSSRAAASPPARRYVAPAASGSSRAADTTGEVYKQLTPYQGPERRYGKFECSQCHRYWKSSNSWADMGQECKDCGELVYPHQQTELPPVDADEIDCNKPHLMHLCEKCKSLGRCCSRRV